MGPISIISQQHFAVAQRQITNTLHEVLGAHKEVVAVNEDALLTYGDDTVARQQRRVRLVLSDAIAQNSVAQKGFALEHDEAGPVSPSALTTGIMFTLFVS